MVATPLVYYRREFIKTGSQDRDVEADLVGLLADMREAEDGDAATDLLRAIPVPMRARLAAVMCGRPALFSRPVLRAVLAMAGREALTKHVGGLRAAQAFRTWVQD